MKKISVFLLIASLCTVANIIMGCSYTVRKPSCGAWHYRITDGATCRECIDGKERYAECGNMVEKYTDR